MRVLVVEDDVAISEPLSEGLGRSGFEVTTVANGGAALEEASGGGVDLVLLDLGLPDLDGTEVCRRIRHHSDVPIIVVTARGDELDRVMLLELGADDYVVKPFGLRELIARIRAVSRRAGSDHRDENLLRVGPLEIDRRTRSVELDGEGIDLTPKEFDLLAYLASDPGRVFERLSILESVWDAHWFGPTKTLDVHIASVRKKLGRPEWIETVRGVGFRLVIP